jgi:hypothetical protein
VATVVAVSAALVGVGEAFVPTSGAGGFLLRVALWAAFPLALWATGFLTAVERRTLATLLRPSAVRARLQDLRERSATARPDDSDSGPEVYEAALRDEDDLR